MPYVIIKPNYFLSRLSSEAFDTYPLRASPYILCEPGTAAQPYIFLSKKFLSYVKALLEMSKNAIKFLFVIKLFLISPAKRGFTHVAFESENAPTFYVNLVPRAPV